MRKVYITLIVFIGLCTADFYMYQQAFYIINAIVSIAAGLLLDFIISDLKKPL